MYQTDVFSGGDVLQDLYDVFKQFAIDNDWTVNGGSWPYLFISKGDCFANFWFRTDLTIDDRAGPSASATTPDHSITFHLSTGYSGIGANDAARWIGQPGSLVTTANSSARSITNDLTPPYSKYWLFSGGDDDPDYIHMVIQGASGRFSAFSLGTVDKRGADYNGGCFMFGTYWMWGFDNASLSSPSRMGSDCSGDRHFLYLDVHNNYNFYVGTDLDPTNYMLCQTGNPQDGAGAIHPLHGRAWQMDGSGFGTNLYQRGYLMGNFPHCGPNPLNNVTPVFEYPVFRRHNANNRSYFMGMVPGLRMAGMKGRTEAETISFGDDDFMLFPWKSYKAWNPEPRAAEIVTSGPYAFAFKVNS